MLKFLTLIAVCFSFLSVTAQDAVMVKYYDSLWSPTTKEAAFFYTEFAKQDNFYNCSSYWMQSKKLNCKSSYADTLFSKPLGLLLRFYENGQVQDSAYFYENGELKNIYHYYASGQLWAHYSYNKNAKTEVSEGYDETGKPVKNFIYLKEAEFPGGTEAWQNYLAQNLKSKIPVKNGAPVGTYQVIVAFIVDTEGKISRAEAKTSLGYGMEEEALRVINKSPKWHPLVLLGNKANAFRYQPITFEVAEK